MTTTEIISQLKGNLRWKLASIEQAIAKYTQDMNNDFEHFFEWNAADMLRQQVMKRILTEYQKVVESEDYSLIYTETARFIHEIEDELFNSPLTRYSSSGMANIYYAVTLKTKQELRRDFVSNLKWMDAETLEA